MELQPVVLAALPPVELVHALHAAPSQPVTEPERRKAAHPRIALQEPANAAGIEMVVMIVRDQHDVDAWQLVRERGCRYPALGTDAGER